MATRDSKPTKTNPQPTPTRDHKVDVNKSTSIGDKSTSNESFISRAQPRRDGGSGSSSGGGKGKG